VRFYQVPEERERVAAMAFPTADDRAGLRAELDASVDGDAMAPGGTALQCGLRIGRRCW
jgi:hypothetical protein